LLSFDPPDLQALLTLLKGQEKSTPVWSSDNDHIGEPPESGRSASPEDYLREMRGENETGE